MVKSVHGNIESCCDSRLPSVASAAAPSRSLVISASSAVGLPRHQPHERREFIEERTSVESLGERGHTGGRKDELPVLELRLLFEDLEPGLLCACVGGGGGGRCGGHHHIEVLFSFLRQCFVSKGGEGTYAGVVDRAVLDRGKLNVFGTEVVKSVTRTRSRE